MNRIYQFKKTVTPLSGSVSFNTIDIRGILRSLIVSPTTASTKWRIALTNNESVVVYRKGLVTGNLVDHRSPLSLYGIYTVAITGATIDEAIKVTINYEELQ